MSGISKEEYIEHALKSAFKTRFSDEIIRFLYESYDSLGGQVYNYPIWHPIVNVEHKLFTKTPENIFPFQLVDTKVLFDRVKLYKKCKHIIWFKFGYVCFFAGNSSSFRLKLNSLNKQSRHNIIIENACEYSDKILAFRAVYDTYIENNMFKNKIALSLMLEKFHELSNKQCYAENWEYARNVWLGCPNEFVSEETESHIQNIYNSCEMSGVFNSDV